MGTSSGNKNKIESRIQELLKVKQQIEKEKESLHGKLDKINAANANGKGNVNDKDDHNSKGSGNESLNLNGPYRDYFMDYVYPEAEPDLLPNGKKRFLDPKRLYIKTNHYLKDNNKGDIGDNDRYNDDKETNYGNGGNKPKRRIREEDIVYVDQLDKDIIDMI